MNENLRIKKFLNNNDIRFKNLDLYIKAFSHLSYINERKMNINESYERQEFLGDSLLGFITAEKIFRTFPNIEPGQMSLLRSRLVNKVNLSIISRRLKIGKYVLLSNGQKGQKISDSILSDILESLICAIYLDLGYFEAERFINDNVLYNIRDYELSNLKDYKTKLQEFFHIDSNIKLEYVLEKKKAKENGFEFLVSVRFDDINLSQGKGKTIKEAEQCAARKAFDKVLKVKNVS